MNTTLKSICSLLKQNDAEIQQAAIRVLGAIHVREPSVHKILGEMLCENDNPAILGAILDAVEHNPHEQILKYLVEALEITPDYQERILAAIAGVGGKGVKILKQQFDRVSSPSRRQIVRVLSRIRTSQAHAFLVECFFSPDHELVRMAVHSLREEINDYSSREKSDLHQRLTAALKDRRLDKNEAALSAIIISTGILADIRSKTKLLEHISADRPIQIRRHALMSLSRLEFSGDKHHDVFDKTLPILKESNYEELVRHAVRVLVGVKPRRSDRDKIRALLKNRHVGVQVFAIQALSKLDSLTTAEDVLVFLHHKDSKLRDAAGEALRQMPSAVEIILRHIDEVKDRGQAFEMVKILESHANRITPERAKSMIKHMLELYRSGDEHYQLYRTALRHLRGDTLQSQLMSMAKKARKKQDFEAVRDYLKLLDHTELMTPEIRTMLAVAKLKTSKKDLSRSFRLSDYCLEHISILLKEEPKSFKRKFLAEKVLEADDLLYVGYHFSECLNEERRFGVDLLRHVAKKWARKDAGKTAKKKLKVEGH